MLQHDYLLELISQFVESITRALRAARIARAAEDVPASLEVASHVEQDIAGLIDMDPDVAMSLAPDSLVTMMVLSGMGQALADYVVFALNQVADIYEHADESEHADLRRAQAQAVAESFSCDPSRPPEELTALAEELEA